MPKATASGETARHELKSCDGGYFVSRRLSYGEMLQRRDLAMDMSAKGDEEGLQVRTNALVVQHYEMSRAIIEHNLTDENDQPLNFKDMQDIVKLDPRVGGEIESIIDRENQPPDDDARKSLGISSA